MRNKLIILGTKGLAREVAMIVEFINERKQYWEFCGFVGEATTEKEKNLGIGSIIGDDNWLLSQNFDVELVIGIGRPHIRSKIISLYQKTIDHFKYPNIIHPVSTFDYRRLDFGYGNVVTAGCRFTCDIAVQNFNYFNLNSTIGHDAQLGSFNVINPSVNISGGVRIADRVLIGTGSQILENITIGSDATVGAGSVVCNDVLPGQTVIGVPARPMGPNNGY